MSGTDWRGLCEELAGWIERATRHYIRDPEVLIRARATLAAEADGPAVPEGREPASVTGEPSDELVAQWIAEVWHEGTPVRVAASDLHLASRAAEWGARYGHQPAPPAEGEVAELTRWLRMQGEAQKPGPNSLLSDRTKKEHHAAGVKLTRAADLLERQAAPVLEPALARINNILNDSGRILQTDELEALELARQALEQRQAAPVPVAERLPGPEDCDAEGRCWVGYPELTYSIADPEWRLEHQPLKPKGSRCCWLPATALPLPAGEVE